MNDASQRGDFVNADSAKTCDKSKMTSVIGTFSNRFPEYFVID